MLNELNHCLPIYELSPLDRTVQSCFWFTVVTQIVLVSMFYALMWIGILIFAIQLPQIFQPFVAAHLNLYNIVMIAGGDIVDKINSVIGDRNAPPQRVIKDHPD